MELLKLNTYKIILASKSPRRQQLVAGMKIDFEVITKDVDESFPIEMPTHEIAEYLCAKKSNAFKAEELADNFSLITADTIVLVDDIVLNKPLNRDEAISMLQMLSGRWHKVITGVCLRCKNKKLTFSESSDVKFGVLSKEEINWYVDQYQPFQVPV